MANVVKKFSISSELAQKMGNEAVAKATHQTAPTQFSEAAQRQQKGETET